MLVNERLVAANLRLTTKARPIGRLLVVEAHIDVRVMLELGELAARVVRDENERELRVRGGPCGRHGTRVEVAGGIARGEHPGFDSLENEVLQVCVSVVKVDVVSDLVNYCQLRLETRTIDLLLRSYGVVLRFRAVWVELSGG